MGEEGRTIRTPRRPALYWAVASACALIACGSLAFMAVRADRSATAEGSR